MWGPWAKLLLSVSLQGVSATQNRKHPHFTASTWPQEKSQAQLVPSCHPRNLVKVTLPAGTATLQWHQIPLWVAMSKICQVSIQAVIGECQPPATQMWSCHAKINAERGKMTKSTISFSLFCRWVIWGMRASSCCRVLLPASSCCWHAQDVFLSLFLPFHGDLAPVLPSAWFSYTFRGQQRGSVSSTSVRPSCFSSCVSQERVVYVIALMPL